MKTIKKVFSVEKMKPNPPCAVFIKVAGIDGWQKAFYSKWFFHTSYGMIINDVTHWSYTNPEE